MRSRTKTVPIELTPQEQASIREVTEEHILSGYPLDLVSIGDVVHITRTPKETIQQWIDNGAIRAWDVCCSPRRRRVSLSEVRAAWLGTRRARLNHVSAAALRARADFENVAGLSLATN